MPIHLPRKVDRGPENAIDSPDAKHYNVYVNERLYTVIPVPLRSPQKGSVFMANFEPVNCPCYCINFRRAANVLSKRYDDALAAVQLTGNQFFLLNCIHALDGCNKTELARYTRLDRTTIIRNLETLKKKGLAEEVPGRTRRNNIIRLSETGYTALTRGAEIWKRLQSDTRQALGEENLSAMWRLFSKIDTLSGT